MQNKLDYLRNVLGQLAVIVHAVAPPAAGDADLVQDLF